MPENTSSAERAEKVLLIEDVEAMRLLLRLTLERHGFEVDEAATLKEARECLKAGEYPGTILLDLELPDGHGLDIVREVPHDTVVIAISADESRETGIQCLNAGCAAVLSKSANLTDIVQAVASENSKAAGKNKTQRLNSELSRQYSSFLVEARIDLQRAHDARDFETARKIAHRLRGTAVHFGYSGVSACALAVGEALASGIIEQIESTIRELADRLADATAAYKVA